MRQPLHWPTTVGFSALSELARVAWRDLAFAYDYRDQPGLTYDIEATLRALADVYWDDALDEAYSNITHQGTVYEATAYAVPFIAALAAGPEITPRLRLSLLALLAEIALGASFDAKDGGHAGSFGEGVGELIREALVQITRYLAPTVELVGAILVLAKEPSPPAFETLRTALLATHEAIEALPEIDDAAPAPVQATARYLHPKFGEAILIRKQENGLLLRFEDKERVVQPRFVTLIEEA